MPAESQPVPPAAAYSNAKEMAWPQKCSTTEPALPTFPASWALHISDTPRLAAVPMLKHSPTAS
ncbi:hypothetical protein EMPG_12740 [Blastomyces silverae]|uniref:Uncharacterized protein n=1 Tax=Blastomyces silverae TaxID=2060906 RepID=A0A0H1BLI0_9EURO|nr:hypothetical protein EMPG_12740 [Blastomyces silverae]